MINIVFNDYGVFGEFRYQLPPFVSGRGRHHEFFPAPRENLGRSQSTISQQIAKLKAQIGRSLLARRKGRVLELTSEGGKLVLYARRILQLNDEAYASMSDDVLAASWSPACASSFRAGFHNLAGTIQEQSPDGWAGGRGKPIGKSDEAQRARRV